MANTPDRWSAVREYLKDGGNRVSQAEASALLAERDTLAAENRALVEALRGQVVDRTGDYGRCVLCEQLWRLGKSERHAADCLARVRE